VRAYGLGGLKRRANDGLVGLAVDGGMVEGDVLKVRWLGAVRSGGGLVGGGGGGRGRSQESAEGGVASAESRSRSRSPVPRLSSSSSLAQPHSAPSSLSAFQTSSPSRHSSFSRTYVHPLSHRSRGTLAPAASTYAHLPSHTSRSRSRSPFTPDPNRGLAPLFGSSSASAPPLPLALSHFGRYVLEWFRCVRVCVCLRRWAALRAARLATRSMRPSQYDMYPPPPPASAARTPPCVCTVYARV
jgi:hypothetical protein